MKRWPILLMLAALLSQGCLGLIFGEHDTVKEKPAVPAPPPPPPVKASDIDPAHPEKTIAALSAELDRDKPDMAEQPEPAFAQPH